MKDVTTVAVAGKIVRMKKNTMFRLVKERWWHFLFDLFYKEEQKAFVGTMTIKLYATESGRMTYEAVETYK